MKRMTLQQRREHIRRSQIKIANTDLTPEQERAIAEYDAAPEDSELKKRIRNEPYGRSAA